jgi:predicted GIY-YIG superfamily endonuclease
MGAASVGGWFVYILRCADGTYYTGITNDLTRRCRQHNDGTASRYTRSRRPARLVYQEPQPDQAAALRREAAIKSLSRRKKALLIRGARRGG